MDESPETLVKGDERGIQAGVDGAQHTGWEWDWRPGKRCRKELCDALKAKYKKWGFVTLTECSTGPGRMKGTNLK